MHRRVEYLAQKDSKTNKEPLSDVLGFLEKYRFTLVSTCSYPQKGFAGISYCNIIHFSWVGLQVSHDRPHALDESTTEPRLTVLAVPVRWPGRATALVPAGPPAPGWSGMVWWSSHAAVVEIGSLDFMACVGLLVR